MTKKKSVKKKPTKGKQVLLTKIEKWIQNLEKELYSGDGYSCKDIREINIELEMVRLFYSAVKKYI